MEGPTKTMGRPIPVILNPAAHSTKAARRAGLLRTLQPAAELHYTTGPGSAAELAEQLAAEGHEIVVAAGGDGTVNEAVHGLARVNSTRPPGQAHTALGILPVGTMNVFSLELGLPGRIWKPVGGSLPQEILIVRWICGWRMTSTSFNWLG
jgi:diacylglycerol kinase (ATP)